MDIPYDPIGNQKRKGNNQTLDTDGTMQSTPSNPKRAGRRKINIEFIEDKSRRHITFSKRKAGIMKKAYELSTLTGTQVLLLVASETGHVYTFATPKLQPLITKPEGKNLIQACLNAPDTLQETPQAQEPLSPQQVNYSAESQPNVHLYHDAPPRAYKEEKPSAYSNSMHHHNPPSNIDVKPFAAHHVNSGDDSIESQGQVNYGYSPHAALTNPVRMGGYEGGPPLQGYAGGYAFPGMYGQPPHQPLHAYAGSPGSFQPPSVSQMFNPKGPGGPQGLPTLGRPNL